MNDGTVFATSEFIARIPNSFGTIAENECSLTIGGNLENIPDTEEGVKLIVSLPCLMANNTRTDLVAPASGHPDCVRHPEKGFVISVPCLVNIDNELNELQIAEHTAEMEAFNAEYWRRKYNNMLDLES